MQVEFFRHSLTEQDVDNVRDVLKSLFLSTGNVVAEFERRFSTYLGDGFAVAVTSCTAALHLSLLASDIGPGDEVITSPMTFCATANAIIHAGATPVFVDVEPTTGNLDVDRVEAAVTNRTRAVIAVHLYGQMVDMRSLRSLADEHDLIVIEDSAHCVEGSRDGIRPGELGDAACFSFYATKNLTSGEGGAILVRDQERAELLKRLRLHGMTSGAAERYSKEYRHWDMTVPGWKYNMDNIHAALLVDQIGRLDVQLDRREVICRRYEEALREIPSVRTMQVVPECRHARHAFTFLAPDGARDDVLHLLQAAGVGVAVNFRAVHLLDYYRRRFGYAEGAYPFAEEIGRRTITLPLYPALRDSEVDYVIECVRDAVGRVASAR